MGNPLPEERELISVTRVSRHGGFFAPYTPVPDVNYGQLLQNIY